MTEGEFVLINGTFHDATKPYLKVNRAFMYGDALFESIRVINGMPYNLESHFVRMIEGAKALGFTVPPEFSLAFFRTQISAIIQKNGIKAGGRVRLSLYRNNGGFYKPTTNSCSYLITADLLPHNLFKLNSEGLLVDIYDGMVKHRNVLSNFKTSNAILSVLAGNYANENNLSDCFLINSNNHIIESISSNVFLVSNGVLYTPPLQDGCIGGTMRMNIVNLALQNNIKIYETSLTPQNLMAADEVFLTNAISGIQWIGGYKSKRYFNEVSKKLMVLINEKEASLKMDLKEN